MPLVLKPAVLLCVVASSRADFNADRVHLLDVVGANFLFRGPIPIVNNTFELQKVKEQLATVALKEGNVSLPSNYTLVDISFLDTIKPSESADLKAEAAFWKAQQAAGKAGQPGRLVHWPIVGSLINPDSYPESVMKQMAKDFATLGVDKVPDKMDAVRAMLEAQPSAASPLPVVVYWHCEAGVDRTGEMSGAYNMMFRNESYQQVFAFNTGVEGREMAKASIHGMEWCCEWLHYGLGIVRGCPYDPDDH